MQPAAETVTTVTNGVKVATAIDHLRNNRIEYLLVLILSHFLGLTERLLNHASGVCF